MKLGLIELTSTEFSHQPKHLIFVMRSMLFQPINENLSHFAR